MNRKAYREQLLKNQLKEKGWHVETINRGVVSYQDGNRTIHGGICPLVDGDVVFYPRSLAVLGKPEKRSLISEKERAIITERILEVLRGIFRRVEIDESDG